MARINISVPDELHRRASDWRKHLNLSDICAQAIRSELDALEFHRNLGNVLDALRPPSDLERLVASRFKLVDVIVSEGALDSVTMRDKLGELTADYLGRCLSDGSVIGIAGGRQMWCVIRNITPRQLDITITALGIGQNDPRVLHAHSNTLTTLLWLLFSPRAIAHIVGWEQGSASVWSKLPSFEYPKYFVVGSCGSFEATSPLASLLGEELTNHLLETGVC